MSTTTLVRIAFLLNDQVLHIEALPGDTALTVLRKHLGLLGTKEGCNEGDCGACTILVGVSRAGIVRYQAQNACLIPAPRLHGTHVLTIECLKPGIHPIQQALLDAGGTQCGFCTPGIIMSLLGLFALPKDPSEQDIAQALEGHLCRCTGYEAIRRAVASLQEYFANPAHAVLPACCSRAGQTLSTLAPLTVHEISCPLGRPDQHYHQPRDLPELLVLLARLPKPVRFLNGGTDLMVEANLQQRYPKHLIDLCQLESLRGIHETHGIVHIGALTTLAEILDSPITQTRLPLLARTVSEMASSQVRAMATLAGNIATGSPIGDGSVALLALDATVRLIGPENERHLPIADFFLGYRQVAIHDDEIIAEIQIPHQSGPWDWRKSARRSAVDIAAVSSAMAVRTHGKHLHLRIACGGAADRPLLLTRTMEQLHGKKLNTDLITQACETAQAEISPRDDVRGSAGYRRLLVRNHIRQHLLSVLGLSEAPLEPLTIRPAEENHEQ